MGRATLDTPQETQRSQVLRDVQEAMANLSLRSELESLAEVGLVGMGQQRHPGGSRDLQGQQRPTGFQAHVARTGAT